MSKIYKSSPITEAVCEFRFEPSQSWDSTYFGLIYERLKDNFPKKKQETGVVVEIDPLTRGARQQVVSAPARMQFLSEDERSLVQLASDVMSINRVKPYDNWANFKQRIMRALDAYRNVNEPKGIRRIGIRYINRIHIPKNEVKIEEYLSAVPSLPSAIPQVYHTWVQRVEVPFPKVHGLLIVQSGSLREKDLDGVAFLLDLDFLIAPPEPIPTESASDAIEMGHAEVENAFEACITDETRQIFNQAGERNG